MDGITLLALAVLGYFAFHHLILQHQKFLQQLCDLSYRGSFRTELRSGNRLWGRRSYIFEGEYQKRRLIVKYTFQPGAWRSSSRSSHANELEIQLPLIQKFWLRLLKESHETAATEEIQIGDKSLDHLFVIHSNQPAAAKGFLLDESVRKWIQVLQLLFSKMEIHHGLLKVVYTEPVLHQLTHFDLELILDTLMRLILLYETHVESFKIMAIPVMGVCPYCREKLDAEQEQVCECSQCGTHVHYSCWKQNGQCTTWGCNSLLARACGDDFSRHEL